MNLIMKKYLCFIFLVFGFVICNNSVNSQCNPPTNLTASPNPVCLGNSVNLNATSSLGLIKWYTTASGSTLIGSSNSGSNFTVTPTVSGTVTYYAAATIPGSASTQTGYTTNNGHAGIMFDLEAKSCAITVTGINGQVDVGSSTAEIYYRTSTCLTPASLSSSGWVYLGCINIVGNGSGTATPIVFPSTVTIPAYQRYAICVLTQNGFKYENGTSFGTVLYSNPDLILYEGYGPTEYSNCVAGFNMSYVNDPRRFRGEIFYTTSCGCESTRVPITVTVTPPISNLTISPNPAVIACNPSSVVLTATPAGGNGSFTYNWSGGSPTNQQSTTVNSATSYTVTAYSGNCSKTASVTVSSNATPPSANISPSSGVLTCSTTSISLTASGGGTYLWNNGSTSPNIIATTAGTYTVTVTSSVNGCTASKSVTITGDSNIPLANITPNNGTLTCSQPNISVTASGGNNYLWSNGLGSSATANITTPGIYTVTVTNSVNGCTSSASITITQDINAPISSISSSANTLNCSITNIILTASGGGIYKWNTNESSANINVTTSGNYIVTVTNQINGCTSTTNVFIAQAPPLVVSYTSGEILCSGGQTTINVTATGGTPPYSATGIFPVPAGNYNFTITDNGGCSENTGNINIPEPPLLTANATISQPILCYGEKATIYVSAQGGTAPYSGIGFMYEYPGSYIYTVTDANGCIANTITVNPIQPTLLISEAVITTPIKCYGETGIIQVSAQGGIAPYIGSGNFNETSGIHNYVVTDANGCTSTTNSINLNQPEKLIAESNITAPVLCHNGNAVVTITANGGIMDYVGIGDFIVTAGNYNYTVKDVNNCISTTSIIVTQPDLLISKATISQPIICFGETATVSIEANGGNLPYNGIGNFQLAAGNHNFTITDINGCISNTSLNIPTPPLLVATISQNELVSCFESMDAKISVTATGGIATYNYLWNDVSNSTNNILSNIGAGNYSVTVTDMSNCSKVANYTVTQPDRLSLKIITNEAASCFDIADGKLEIAGIGGTSPYSYKIIGNNKTYNSRRQYNLIPGDYDIQIIDKNYCSIEALVYIDQPEEIVITPIITNPTCKNGKNGIIDLKITGGIEPFSIYLNNKYLGTNPLLKKLDQGIYSVTIKDSNNCKLTIPTIVLNDKDVSCIDAPNVFTPNGDGINDTWEINNIYDFDNYEISIFNRWGQQIFNSTDYKPWDGKYKNKLVSAGTYLYVINLFDEAKKYSGTVTILY